MNKDETQRYCRECFGTPAGRKVLGLLLADMGFFDDNISNPQEVGVANYARKIIKNLGLGEMDSIDDFVTHLFQIPVKDKKSGQG